MRAAVRSAHALCANGAAQVHASVFVDLAPATPYADYIRELSVSDLALDSFHFGGCNALHVRVRALSAAAMLLASHVRTCCTRTCFWHGCPPWLLRACTGVIELGRQCYADCIWRSFWVARMHTLPAVTAFVCAGTNNHTRLVCSARRGPYSGSR